MRLRGVIVVAALSVAAASLPALASDSTPRVQWRTAAAVHGDLGPASGSPERWATSAATRMLGATDLRVERVHRSLIGTHVRGRQYRAGVPIVHTDWVVTAIGGRVVQAAAHPSSLPGAPTPRPVSAALAQRAALTALGSTSQLTTPSVERLLVPRAGRLVDTYRVSVLSRVPARPATIDVAAATGRALAIGDDSRRLDGSTLVFDPNPVVTSRDIRLRQPLESGMQADPDLDSQVLTDQRRRLPLRELDSASLAAGLLSGPYVNVLGGGYSATVNAGAFDVTRSDPRFEGLMAYAHLDRYQRYLQSLGFRGAAAVNSEPQDVVATRVEGFDNSFYQPALDVLLFGAGGVDDAEDADVVLHEYGHAMQDAQVPGFGFTTESGAMGEGFGDFQSAAYSARTSGGFGDLCFADWDTTSLAKSGQTTPACLRRLDSTKRYPDDMVDEVHDDGEIWSAFLWDVRAGLPGDAAAKSDRALRLVIASHELLTSEATFFDAVDALRTTARALGHPDWVRGIERAAAKRGLPLEP